MRKGIFSIVLAAALVLTMVLTPAVVADNENGNGCDDCEPLMVVDLIAGQNMGVGTVTVENDDEKLCVTYALNEEALDEGWGIYETHLAIGNELADIPQTRGNRWGTNPIPGQFEYGDDELEGVEEWAFCILLEDLDVDYEDELYIAAHAVVKRLAGYGDAVSATIYGVGTVVGNENEGNIYVIYPLAQETDVIFEDVWGEANMTPGPRWYPNALAFDEENGRLYFTLDQNSLYFFDVKTEAVVDADPDNKFSNDDNVLGAAFGDGYYWYLINRSNTLGKVTFNGDGIVTDVAKSAMVGAPALTQGDIVYDDRMIYGSSGTGAGGIRGFFSYHIEEEEFIILYEDPSYLSLQLAWGLDEYGEKVLYGHRGIEGWWCTIDLETGLNAKLETEENDLWTTDRLEDLASGFEYEEIWEDETAWGEGERFNKRGNWGMWFEYKICDPCPEAQLLLNTGAEEGMNHWDFTPSVVRSIDERLQSTGMVYSRSGDYFFDFTGADVSAEGIGYAASMSQRVDVTGYDGCPFTAGGWIQTELWPDSAKTDIEDNDYGKLIVTFYDIDDNVLESFTTGIIGNPVKGHPTTDGRQYAEFDLAGAVPAEAVYAVYELEGYLIQGAFINVFYDDLYFWVGK